MGDLAVQFLSYEHVARSVRGWRCHLLCNKDFLITKHTSNKGRHGKGSKEVAGIGQIHGSGMCERVKELASTIANENWREQRVRREIVRRLIEMELEKLVVWLVMRTMAQIVS